jgi:hypothetical protein
MWSKDADARLRTLNAEGYSDRDIGAALGCGHAAVGRRRLALGLPCQRFSPRQRAKTAAASRAARGEQAWTDEQRELLRREFRHGDLAQLAARLGHSIRAVRTMAYGLGLRRWVWLPRNELRRIRRLNARGYCDKEIARVLARDVGAVANHRRAMGLPCRRAHQRQRSRQSARTKAHWDRDPFFIHYDRAERERFAEASGWPKHISPKAVAMLNLLAAVGVPLTTYEMSACLPGARRETNHLSRYTAKLLSVGLVVAVTVRRPGRNGRPQVRGVPAYTLSPLALSLLEERAKCEKLPPSK